MVNDHCSLLCKQLATSDHDRVNKLLDILLRRDDRQLPLFCDILTADRQPHIVELFRRNGTMLCLRTFMAHVASEMLARPGKSEAEIEAKVRCFDAESEAETKL